MVKIRLEPNTIYILILCSSLMNQEESVSILTQKPSKNVKKGIIQILATDFPLTTKHLHTRLQRLHGITVSYQAVHKVMKELNTEGITTKSTDGWQLNNEWLQSQEKFIQGTKQKYAGNKNQYNIDMKDPKPQVFEFDNFTDLCVETAKLLMSCQLNHGKQEPFHMIMEYGWWSLKFKFEHLQLLYDMVKKCPNAVGVVRKKTRFGKWVISQYKRIGGIQAPIGTPFEINEDVIAQGDYVIQVHFSDEGRKIIRNLWNKWSNLEDSFKEFGLKNEPKMQITVTVTKNPAIAKFIKERIKEKL